METSGAGGYDKFVPYVRERVEKYLRALDGVRATHRGRPVSEVRSALDKAFEAEDLEVWNEVRDDAARVISEETEQAQADLT
ncbi:hypothetical protein Pth03_46430 [Planotetraspora thailandica]|uniref:Uncharacterized protein n=1 Tax=Planotetraspora thailandica TaxID=487172 RepID=A0A8J3XX65_9ACTN|nr:hypothetical protein [Planotetraspora thailandica]GII56254.1 hypothetical protein Pth03_46430 [Planotetraspora thailandica]